MLCSRSLLVIYFMHSSVSMLIRCSLSMFKTRFILLLPRLLAQISYPICVSAAPRHMSERGQVTCFPTCRWAPPTPRHTLSPPQLGLIPSHQGCTNSLQLASSFVCKQIKSPVMLGTGSSQLLCFGRTVHSRTLFIGLYLNVFFPRQSVNAFRTEEVFDLSLLLYPITQYITEYALKKYLLNGYTGNEKIQECMTNLFSCLQQGNILINICWVNK